MGLDLKGHGPYRCRSVVANHFPVYVNGHGWKLSHHGGKWVFWKPPGVGQKTSFPVLELEHDMPVPPLGRPFQETAHTAFHLLRGVNVLSDADKTVEVFFI